MSILFAGTSITDFSGSITVATSAASLAPNVVEGIFIEGSASCDFAPVSDIWVSTYFRRQYSADGDRNILTLLSAGNPLFAIAPNAAAGISEPNTFILRAWDGATWFSLDESTTTFADTATTRLDFHVTIDGTVGVFDLYANGALIASFAGDTDLVANTGIDSLTFDYAFNGAGTIYSAVIVADEDTRAMSFVQCKPTGAGANQQWTGTFADIDETGYNDGDAITTTTPGEISTFTKAALPAEFSTAHDIAAVVVSARCGVGDEATQDIYAAARIGATDYDLGDFGASVGVSGHQVIAAVSPATSAAWTFAELDAAEIGVKLA